MGEIIPLVLCGGSGSRLWPLSHADKPKQFLSLIGTTSLFAQALERCSGPGFSTRPIIVAAEAHADLVAQELCKAGRTAEVILEPVRRDSCAAVLVGSMAAMARDVDAMVLVVASDHIIPDEAAYRATVVSAWDAAAQGFIVTFGVTPTEPATSYGYIAPSQENVGVAAKRISSFHEKPDLEKAKCLVAEGCLWNSGNFLFRARHLLEEASRLVPDVHQAARQSMGLANRSCQGLKLEEQSFSSAPRISFDHTIMEKTVRAAVLPVFYVWHDLGTWDALANVRCMQAGANLVSGPSSISQSHDCMVISEEVPVALSGCEGLIVVATKQGVLVARKGPTEHVKSLAEDLTNEGLGKAISNSSPLFKLLDETPNHCVNRITISVGRAYTPVQQTLTKQWFVVSGNISAGSEMIQGVYSAGQTFGVQA